MQAFLDSSAIIYGLEIQCFINEKVLAEIKRYFRSRKDRDYAYLVEVFLRRNCIIIKNSELVEQMKLLEGEIKRKDLEHIATVRQKEIHWLVAYDQDFKGFSEYVKPREFMRKIGLKRKEAQVKTSIACKFHRNSVRQSGNGPRWFI